MRTKKFIYNSVSSGILQIFTLLGGLILPRLYITTYGSEINGLVNSVVQFVSYFSYVEAGLGVALIYALYKPLAEKDQSRINGIASLAKKSYIKASIIYLLLVICFSFVYPFIVASEMVDNITIFMLVFVIGISGALDFYTLAKYKVLLTADQKEYIISLVSIIAYFINFVITCALILHEYNIVIVRLAPLVTYFLKSFLLYLYVKRKYSFLRYNFPYDTIHLQRRWDALLLQLSVSLNLSVPIVIVSIFCSLKMASVYSIYSMIFVGLIGIISVFTSGVTASFGNIVANKEYKVLGKVHSQFELSIFAITGFLYACTLILINSFISIYTQGVTDINYLNPTYGILFVVWGILHNIRIPYTALVNANGLYRETRKVNILQILILIVLSIILVQFFQIIGVLIALIVAALYRGIDLILVVHRLVLKTSLYKTFMRIILMFVIVVASYLPFYFWININATSLYGWFVQAIGVAIWCCFVTILVSFLIDRKGLKGIINRLVQIIPHNVLLKRK
ncbi:polysaccharide transport protein, putative [Dehalobacter sp. CF]|nr:polysaccharide transport protein, putative [Dehalobacter sp. CF]